MPGEYSREVFGGDMRDAREFASLDEAKDILGLMTLLPPKMEPISYGTGPPILAVISGNASNRAALDHQGDPAQH